jgi:polysaccharide biosynthesis protein PslH
VGKPLSTTSLNDSKSMSSPKFLLVTPVVPLPPTGGGTRSFHFLRAAAESGIVDLICLQELDTEALEQLQPYCNNIVHKGQQPPLATTLFQIVYYWFCMVVPFLFSTSQLNHELGFFVRQRLKQFPVLRSIYFEWLLLAFKLKRPLPAIAYQLNMHSKWWKRQLKDYPMRQYDALLVDFTYMGFIPPMLGVKSADKVYFNAHNAEYEIIQQSVQLAEDAVEKKWMKLQADLMNRTEAQCIFPGSQIFCCSADDKKKFEELAGAAHVHIIPNGVDLDYFQPRPVSVTEPVLLFTGTMNYHPNEDAMNWFIKEIYPLILAEVPLVKLIIAGRRAKTISTFGHSSIELVNDPEDMRPLFEKAAIVIVPLRIGSGTRLKILEAAAMQKAIVTTSLGREGLPDATGDILITANTAETFAQATIELLNDPLRCERLGKAAGAWVAVSYSWKKIRSHISALFNAD